MKKLVFCGFAVALALSVRGVDSWRIEPFELDALNTAMEGTSGPAVTSPTALAAEICIMGMAGDTVLRAGMAENLKLMSTFDQAFASIRASYTALSASNQAVVAMAPSIWSAKPRAFQREFLHTIQDNFGAEAGVLVDPLALNAWTSTVTEGRIPEIIPQTPENAEITLVCGILAEAAWPHAMESEGPGAFRGEDGAERPEEFFRGKIEAMQFKRPGMTAYILPLAAPKLKFIAILPDEGAPLAEMRRVLLDVKALEELKASYRIGFGRDVTVGEAALRFPKIDVTTRRDTLADLLRYGAPESGYQAFAARTPKLTHAVMASSVRIDGRGQTLTPGISAKMALDEAEARKKETPAARRRREEAEAAKPPPVFEIDLSRPFVFALWDVSSNTIPAIGEFK